MLIDDLRLLASEDGLGGEAGGIGLSTYSKLDEEELGVLGGRGELGGNGESGGGGGESGGSGR